MPTPRGKVVNVNIFVDTYHTENQVTIRSHAGIMIYINMDPIQ